jgi:stage V sporulation protein D (sporulation-specific penicillin-binding protein)
LTVDEAGAMLDTKGLLMKLVGKEGIIKDQVPKGGAEVPLHTSIIVYLEDLWAGETADRVYLPDLKGMTVKEVGEILSYLGLIMEPVGSGIVVEQEPLAETELETGSKVKVYFSSPLQ